MNAASAPEGAIPAVLQRIVSEPVYAGLGPEKVAELALQLATFTISIVGSCVGAGILYFLVTRRQDRLAETAKEIDRHRLLNEFEDAYSGLVATPAVRIPSRENFDGTAKYAFVVALTREFKWQLPADSAKYEWVDEDRMLTFTPDGCHLNSTVLHEFLYWFRRIQRAYDAGLLKAKDIYELWRRALPFVTDGRYAFLVGFWGGRERREQEDIQAIRAVVLTIIAFCIDAHKREPLAYLEGRIDEEFVASLKPSLDAAAIKLMAVNASKAIE